MAVAAALSCVGGCGEGLPEPAAGGPPSLPGSLSDAVAEPPADLADVPDTVAADGDDADSPTDLADDDAGEVADAPAEVSDASDLADTLPDPDTVADTAPDVPLSPPASCLALVGQVDSGIHAIDPDGAEGQPALSVYCDMETLGGGWTLVGRSDGAGSVTGEGFGWTASTGSPEDFEQPYSLDVAAAGLAFTEILVGSRSGMSWVNAYRLEAPADFLVACAEQSCVVPGGPVYVAGECTSLQQGEPQMLSRVGFTNVNGRFHLRDISGDGLFGLFERGFALAEYMDCYRGGELDGSSGMIMVR